jgi:hypothetical protein
MNMIMFLKVRAAVKKLLPVDADKYSKYKKFFDSILTEMQPDFDTALENRDWPAIEKRDSIDNYFSLKKIEDKIEYLNQYLYEMFGINRPKKHMGNATTKDIIRKTCAQIRKTRP